MIGKNLVCTKRSIDRGSRLGTNGLMGNSEIVEKHVLVGKSGFVEKLYWLEKVHL